MNTYSNISTNLLHKASSLVAISPAHTAECACIGTTSSNITFTSTVWVALGAIFAAILTLFLTRQIKISEFRQAWINDLRDDIAEYISKADEWVDIYLEYKTESQVKIPAPVKKMDKIKYQSFRILRRIELRFKPDDEEGNLFIINLLDLLDPKKFPSPKDDSDNNLKNIWKSLADDAVFKARHILKKEWEVTKAPFSHRQ
jgi:hypothetical protein